MSSRQRSSSVPSASFGQGSSSTGSVISLENIEELQDRWIKQYELSRTPPPPPLLTSPRSIRACELCGLDPATGVAKLSLRQHLNAVMGSSEVEDPIRLDTPELKSAMKTALTAFQKAGIGLGTGKEKMIAYRNFCNQEKSRASRLSEAQGARRRLLMEGGGSNRKLSHCVEKLKRSSPRRNSAPHPSGSILQQSQTSLHEETPCPAPLAKAGHTRTAKKDASDGISLDSPFRDSCSAHHSGAPTPKSSRRDGKKNGGDLVSPANLASTTLQSDQVSANGATTPYQSCKLPRSTQRSSHHAEGFFTPVPRVDGKPAYTPRDAERLNKLYFSNRSVSHLSSNPCGAPLGNFAFPGPLSSRSEREEFVDSRLCDDSIDTERTPIVKVASNASSIGSIWVDILTSEAAEGVNGSNFTNPGDGSATLPAPLPGAAGVKRRSVVDHPVGSRQSHPRPHGDTHASPTPLPEPLSEHTSNSNSPMKQRGKPTEVLRPSQPETDGIPSSSSIGLPATSFKPVSAEKPLRRRSQSPHNAAGSATTKACPTITISSAEQGELMYYYCANATASRRVVGADMYGGEVTSQ